MNRRRLRFRLAAIALPLVLSAQALAQPSPPPVHRAPPSAAAVDQANQLRAALKLSPGQEGALQAMIAALAAPPKTLESAADAGPRDQRLMTTPERLDAMLAHMDDMRATMAARVAAVKAFYDQLSSQQRRVFDTLPPPTRMGPMHSRDPGPPPPR